MPRMDVGEIDQLVLAMAQEARSASLQLATIPSETKDAALLCLAAKLEEHADKLIEENARDLQAAEMNNLRPAMIERLALSADKIAKIADGVRKVAALKDPVGEELEVLTREDGLVIRKVRVPIGVVGIIYESRPNVTIDCAALCLKSGNASILRGGKEAIHSNRALAAIIKQALHETGVTEGAVQLVPTQDRSALSALLKLDQYIHCIIPRGGEGLIRFVSETANMPVIKHYKGVCNVYVDKEADPDLAERIVLNAKAQRPSVCNAAENFFIHRDAAENLLPGIARKLRSAGVELRVDPLAAEILEAAGDIAYTFATEADFHEEYLDYILAVKVVNDLDSAITAVNTYGSSHSDAIVTANEQSAQRFMNGVDSATVYWNASTRFTDGFEFGLGAEIGISTDRLHARGPMGLRELCTYKYLIYGQGHTKE